MSARISDETNTFFGFDQLSDIGRYHEELEEIANIRKRVAKKYPLAKFTRPSSSSLAIKLTPASMCWDVIVEFNDGYLVKTVSTCRERDIAYDDREKYRISYREASFTNVTTNPNRVMKLINETRSVTGERVLENAMRVTLCNFDKGLKLAQERLFELQRRVFNPMMNTRREEALLEYSLATIEGRQVRQDVRHDVETLVHEYLNTKKELGESVSACEGLQTLSLFKIDGNDKVFFHYRDTTAGEMQRIKYVDDVNKLPREVLTKAAVLQTTGRDAMERIGWGGTRVLTSIGALEDCKDIAFMDTAMCVYVTPETMAEVEALVGY